ncbi:MAG TPA: hypothetical protein VEV15_08680, partial [Flavisolibacter sp.]|nr:hypothetical protein [Flavisolibacter sp.]
FLLCVSTLWACNNAESNKKEEATTFEDHASPHEEARATLILNNGAKWKSDESTNSNVAQLKAVTSRFHENKNKSLADYITAGNELQTGVDKMIKECRMQGADHDALHLWLEPLMKNVAALKKAASEQEASQALAGITARLDMYTQYFE